MPPLPPLKERAVKTSIAMGIICSHPTVTLNYRVREAIQQPSLCEPDFWQFNGVDANTLYWEIYEASKAHHFRLESHDDQRYHLELEFVSPLCQYSDILAIQVQSVGGGGAEAVVRIPPDSFGRINLTRY